MGENLVDERHALPPRIRPPQGFASRPGLATKFGRHGACNRLAIARTLHCKGISSVSNLDRALEEISAIRGQMARASEFRGYGPATFAATGLLAALVAVGQAIWLKDAAAHVPAYLALWIATAAVSAAIIGFEMVTRSRRMHSDLAGEMIRAAVEQFLPAAAAGALITATLW